MNIKKEILDLCKVEDIEAISINTEIGYDFDRKAKVLFFLKPNIEDGLRILDVDFDDGFGHEKGHKFYIWTSKNIIFKSVYDGAEGICVIPRNPDNGTLPESFGGG